MKHGNSFSSIFQGDSAVTNLKFIPDIFLTITLGLILVNDLSKKFFSLSFFDSKSVILTLASPLIISIVIMFYRILTGIKKDIHSLKRLDLGVLEVLGADKDIPCKDLMKRSKTIKVLTLSGSIIFPLDDEDVQRALFDTRRNSKIIILISDPFSDAIIARYSNDEPPTREAGVNAIKERIIWLYNIIQSLDDQSKNKLEVRLYENYPTISIFNADYLVYTSHYAYKLRDKDTPTICSDANGDYGKSILNHFNKVYFDSQPIAKWVATNFHEFDRKILKPTFKTNYSGIFFQKNDGRYIFQRRDNSSGIENRGKLSVFGGRAYHNEDPVDTALRELKEETGITATSNELCFITSGPYPINKNECMWCSYYLLKNVDEKHILLMEGSAFEIYEKENALGRRDITDYPMKILNDYL